MCPPLSKVGLTLCLQGGSIQCSPSAKSAPVPQGLTFYLLQMIDNSYLCIYLKVISPPGPEIAQEEFQSCLSEPGVILKYQNLSVIFISEAIMSCDWSKQGILGMLDTYRLLPNVCHMYFTCFQRSVLTLCAHLDMCRHMKYTLQPTGNGLNMLGIHKNPCSDPSDVYLASFCLILEGGASDAPPLQNFTKLNPCRQRDNGQQCYSFQDCECTIGKDC